MEFRFISAGCGHAITIQNLGGKCMRCNRICCKECLILLDKDMLCPSCFLDRLKE